MFWIGFTMVMLIGLAISVPFMFVCLEREVRNDVQR